MKVLGIAVMSLLITSAAAAQTPIQFGEQRSVSICNGSESFSVDVQPGDRLAVFCTELQDYGGDCSPYCCCFDQRISVVDANGSQVEEQSYVQGNCCWCQTRLTFLNTRLEVGGTTIINVGDANGGGGGLLKLVVQRVNAPGLVEDSLSVGVSYLGSTTPGGVQTFVLRTEETAVHYVTMRAAENSSVQPRMALYDNGRLLDADEDNDGAVCFTGVPGGRYVLLAYSALYESGLYRVNVSAVGRCPVSVEPTTWSHIKVLYR